MNILNLFGKAAQTELEKKHSDLQRLLALADVGDNPVWKAVLEFADEHATNEHATAIVANLNSDQRHYNAGRSAGAYDFALALRDIQAKAELAARKLKAKDED